MTDAEQPLTEWAAVDRSRDDRVLTAHRAGVSKHRIWVLTGIARTTIDRIIAASEITCQRCGQPKPDDGNDMCKPCEEDEGQAALAVLRSLADEK